MKYFWTPPKRRRIRTVANLLGHMIRSNVFVYTSSLWPGQVDIDWLGAVKLLSNPFIENYHLIIVIFYAHFSAFMIFFKQKKTHKISMQGSLTFKNNLYKFNYCYITINKNINSFKQYSGYVHNNN